METKELKELKKIIKRINCTKERISQLKKQRNSALDIKAEEATLRFLFQSMKDLEESI